MNIKEGCKVKLKNGSVAKVYSIGLAIGNLLPDLINLDNGTFCFKDDIEEVLLDDNCSN